MKQSLYLELEDKMKKHNVPGVSLAVIKDFELDWVAGLGVRQWRTTNKVNHSTMFQAGSISKALCSLAVLKLVDQGLLKLDEDVNKYLVRWKMPPTGGWTPIVTVRHLLSHRAGTNVKSFSGYSKGNSIPSIEQVLNGHGTNSPTIRIKRLPDIQYYYSGGGIVILQLMLEDILKQSFQEIMQTLVLNPLGMSTSTFDQLVPMNVKNISLGHVGGNEIVKGGWRIYPELAAAGLWSTPIDLARFGIALQKIIRGDEGGILSVELTNEMLSRTKNTNMGLGLFLDGNELDQRFGHEGWNEGYAARISFSKKNGNGIVIMINSNKSAKLMDEIVESLLKHYNWAGYEAEKQLPYEFTEYCGLYKTSNEESISITIVHNCRDKLELNIDNQPPLILNPKSNTRFMINEMEVSIEFTVDQKFRKITGLFINQGGENIYAQKITDFW